MLIVYVLSVKTLCALQQFTSPGNLLFMPVKADHLVLGDRGTSVFQDELVPKEEE